MCEAALGTKPTRPDGKRGRWSSSYPGETR